MSTIGQVLCVGFSAAICYMEAFCRTFLLYYLCICVEYCNCSTTWLVLERPDFRRVLFPFARSYSQTGAHQRTDVYPEIACTDRTAITYEFVYPFCQTIYESCWRCVSTGLSSLHNLVNAIITSDKSKYLLSISPACRSFHCLQEHATNVCR